MTTPVRPLSVPLATLVASAGALIALIAPVLVLSSCGPECDDLLDCPLDQVCSREGTCIPEPGPRPVPPCEIGESSELFDNERGLPDGDTIWECPLPLQTVGGDGPRFTGVTGTRVTVSGSLFQLELAHDGDFPPGSILIYGVDNNRYFARNLDGPLENPLRAELFVRPFADDGTYDFYIGVDPGLGTQDVVQPTSFFHTDLRVIGVGSGDIQVNVSWDSVADVDLHVFSPTGEHVFYAQNVVESGGNLDLDSNVGCGASDDRRNENIVWPTGTAIDGDYRVQVNLFGNDCGASVTNYRVVVIRDLEVFEFFEGRLESSEVGQNNGEGELVTTVSWPP